jgi:uncharacterized protein (TIGR03083 family)
MAGYSRHVLDLADAYAETQANLADLVRGLPAERLATVVPASPDWDVKDVVAHVTGIAGDTVGGTIPPELNPVEALNDPAQAEMREALTAEQVSSRRGRSIEEILEEWAGHLEQVLPMMRGETPFPRQFPFADAIVLTDLAVHAQDVRSALGVPGDRDSAGVSVALVGYVTSLGLRLALNCLQPLRIRYGEKERIAGEGEPGATWEGDRFEIFRALAGRRSGDQIMAMAWTGDPTPYVPLIPAYGPRTDPIIE